MKNTITIIGVLILIGCSYVTQSDYTFKTSDRYPIFTGSDVEKNRVVGVAMLIDGGTNDTSQIKNGIFKFVRHETKEVLNYEIMLPDIGAEISIDSNRHITNIDDILNKYPKMRYALVLWKSKPTLHKGTTNIPKQITSNGQTITVYDVNYNTTILFDSEIILFDLFDKKIMAKAKKKIEYTRTYTKSYKKPGNDVISQTVAILDLLTGSRTTPKDYYPQIDESSAKHMFEIYVFQFLKNINEK